MGLIDKVINFFNDLQPVYLVEFLLLAIVFFFVLDILRKNNARVIIVFFSLYVLAIAAIHYMSDKLPAYAVYFLVAIFVLAVVCMFSTEIKRAVWNSMKNGDSKYWDGATDRENAKECINEIIKAVQSMSKNNVGAIIILANSNMPNAILDSGVPVNSDISSALIESIFFPKTPLHDGAMVINGTKVQAAGCFLPLSQELNLPKELGTRHRAGIGITETINVTAIIVSEETGVISVAHGGKLKRYADTEMLKNTLKSFYWQDMIN
ncbi:MAG: DNA integrity scanning protein DisA nucleotide-binding domain protein [Clostridia bacterium]|nr:DNA integrity scanning protein DisA nucleotide-binding domain protein [Clostridia bacterium]